MVKSEHTQTPEEDAQRIRNYLTDIRARMYRQALLQTVTMVLFCGLILLVILSIINRLIPLPMPMSNISWMVLCVSVIVAVCLSIKQWKHLSFVAQVVDEKMELKERLRTAFGLIQHIPEGEFAHLQIRDAAEIVTSLDTQKVCPYRAPKLLRLLPIPLLLIGLSFTIPLFYEVPQPLNASQQQALDRVIQNLEEKQVRDPELQKHIRDTVDKLKAATDLDTAQAYLSNLNTEVRKQKLTQDVITEATEASQHFQGMDAEQLASALKDLTEEAEIPSELQAELQSLFEQLSANLPEGELHNSLNQAQGKVITPETLQEIIDAMQEAATPMNLAQLEGELRANRKELALAAIETKASDGGVANVDGAPGQNAGTSEVQGTREVPSNVESQSLSAADNGQTMNNTTDEENLTTPLLGDEAPVSQINGKRLTLTADSSGDSESFSNVFTGEVRVNAPPYLPFSDVVLNATRAYAEAINNNRIPVKYQTQIKDYLEAISEKNEKKRN